MPLIDDQGRVFGKINLIDAIVVALVVGLVPVAYAAYQLFRVPVPVIGAVTPSRIVEKQPATVQLTGTDLRPFLRAWFGTYESAGFLVQSPTQAEIKVPATLPLGTYDLILYDEGQELVRAPGVLTVAPPAQTFVTARVRFIAQPELHALIRAGAVDVGGPRAGDIAGEGGASGRATLTAIDPGHRSINARETFDPVSGRRFEIDQPMVVFTATVRVPVTQARNGWQYKEKPVKLGVPFVFETLDGLMDGSIESMSVEPVQEPAAK